MAEAHHWVSVVMTFCLELALPVYLGSRLDARWETGSAFSIAGALLGMVVSITHLLYATRESDSTPPDRKPPGSESP